MNAKKIRRKNHKKQLALLLASIAATSALCCSCSSISRSNTEQYSKSGTYFDTVINIKVYGKENAKYLDGCMDLSEHYENLLSNKVAGSDISRINHANGKYVKVDKETIQVLKKGLYYCRLSNGAFDITIGKVSDLWDFDNNDGTIPDRKKIKQAVRHVNYKNIKIKGRRVALTDPDAEIDLGGIAKGYIADRIKDYLKKHGVSSGIINLGGNVVVMDKKNGTDKYTVGIEKPFDTNQVLGVLTLANKSVVTSGVYQRYFKKDGMLYHHILNTKTGFPVHNSLYSVTIISDDSVDGDGLSTTCFVLGLKEGMKLIENTDDTEAIFVNNNYKLHVSSGIRSGNISFQKS